MRTVATGLLIAVACGDGDHSGNTDGGQGSSPTGSASSQATSASSPDDGDGSTNEPSTTDNSDADSAGTSWTASATASDTADDSSTGEPGSGPPWSFVIDGAGPGDELSWEIAAAGDINGDGYADFALAAPGAGVGKVYVALGGPTLSDIVVDQFVAGVDGWVFTESKSTGQVGQSVASIGDMNGDGFDDILAGAPYTNGTGGAYVVWGKPDNDTVWVDDVTAGQGGFFIAGEEPSGLTGSFVAAPGDLDDDGIPDMVIAAPGGGVGPLTRIYIVWGKADSDPIALADVAVGDGGFVIIDDVGDPTLGDAIAPGGDIDGNGHPDLLIGIPSAPEESWNGQVYVVLSPIGAGPITLSELAAGIGGFVIEGSDGESAGGGVAGAGDIDGDGLGDILVGAPNAAVDGLQYTGKAYAVFGKLDTSPVALTDVGAGVGGFAILGEAQLDFAGNVGRAGDLDGDGLAELLVGAHGSDIVGNHSGRAYLVWGKSDGNEVRLTDVAAGIGGFSLEPATLDESFGLQLAVVGDIDGSGLPDLVVGAYDADHTFPEAGRAYVWLDIGAGAQ